MESPVRIERRTPEFGEGIRKPAAILLAGVGCPLSTRDSGVGDRGSLDFRAKSAGTWSTKTWAKMPGTLVTC